MKTLLCLLSEQHVPNLLSVHHVKPDRLILVETEGMKKVNASENFRQALALGKTENLPSPEIVEIQSGKDGNFPVLLGTFGEILKSEQTDTEWVVNLTGGLKPMAIAAYETFSRAAQRRFLYTEFRTPNIIDNFLTGEKTTCDYSLGIEEFLSGYGFEFDKKIEHVYDAEEWAEKHSDAAYAVARHATTIRCWGKNALMNERKRVRKFMTLKTEKKLELEPGDLEPNEPEVRKVFCEKFGFQEKGDSLLGSIDKPTARFIDGGWLENVIWLTLHRHMEQLGLIEVRLGLEIRGKGQTTQSNELDITVMKKNYTFEFMECKSGSQEHDSRGDIFYKIEAVRKSPGAGRTKSYFVSNSNTFSGNGIDFNTDALQLRAKSYDCTPILGKSIERLAAEHDNAETVRDIFGW